MTAAALQPRGPDAVGTTRGGVMVAAARTMGTEEKKRTVPSQNALRTARVEQLQRCTALLQRLPPMDAPTRYARSWSIQAALDQHGSLKRQREILLEIARSRVQVRQSMAALAELALEDALTKAREASLSGATQSVQARKQIAATVKAAMEEVRQRASDLALEVRVGQTRMAVAVEEIRKSQEEMRALKKAIDDKNSQRNGDAGSGERQHYVTNCKVGGHGARFCEYLLQRPNWNVFPHQKWFQDEVKGDQYFCPLGKHTVDFVDETQFSRVAMYLKGRIWLEEKTRVWEMVPEIMPPTFIIVNRAWKGDGPPEAIKLGLEFNEYVEAPADTGWWEAAQKEPTAKEITEEEKQQAALALKGQDELLPWFLKEADRNR